jgi:anti-sigma B factor antagonist
MSATASSTYLVDTTSDPVMIRILGRASFQNSASLKDFLSDMRRQGRNRFVIDFHHCTSMDSTFLGVLAGAALELRKNAASGSLVLCRVGERNLELVQNLGLHRLLLIDTGAVNCTESASGVLLPGQAKFNELDNARLVLAAHENLIEVDDANRTKFQDVLTFLKNRVSQG